MALFAPAVKNKVSGWNGRTGLKGVAPFSRSIYMGQALKTLRKMPHRVLDTRGRGAHKLWGICTEVCWLGEGTEPVQPLRSMSVRPKAAGIFISAFFQGQNGQSAAFASLMTLAYFRAMKAILILTSS